MAYTTINKHTDYFNTVTWTGTSDATTSVTGVGFQPDWVWIKNRDVGDDHMLFDAVRGVTKRLFSNQNIAEGTDATTLTSFDSDGFTTGDSRATGGNAGNKMVSWNWKANGSTTVSNTDGTITSTVTANQTAGFSIVKWTGDSSASATVGHGLGATPQVIITKEMNGTDWWHMYHHNLATNYNLFLNTSSAQTSPSDGTLANVGSSTFGFQGSSNVVAVNESGINNIGYCFVEKTGYSKFGEYKANNNADGTFIYTGFAPSWILIKNAHGGTNSGTASWVIHDNKRDPKNPSTKYLYPDLYNTEADNSAHAVDLLSNGFKIRNTTANENESGATYIYMAFGQSLVGSNNVPCTAR